MMKLLLAFLTLAVTSALDVQLVDVVCDESLPVTLDMYVRSFDNGSRCTFGEPVMVNGTFHYKGVSSYGVDSDAAYASATLSLWTLDFTLLDMLQISLCSDSYVAAGDNQNSCPGDGSYSFSVEYKLPKAGAEQQSWLASGWEGSGLLQLFAQPDTSMKIGECQLVLRTYVTQKDKDSLLGTPSAAQTAGIVLGTLAALALLCFYCYCCMRKKKETAPAKTELDEEVSSFFKRMEDEKSFAVKSVHTKDTKSVVSALA